MYMRRVGPHHYTSEINTKLWRHHQHSPVSHGETTKLKSLRALVIPDGDQRTARTGLMA